MEVLIMCINGGRGMKVTLNTNKHHVITKSSTAQNAIHSCCYSYHYLTHIRYDVLHSSSLNSSERPIAAATAAPAAASAATVTAA
jgi:hypothetical protein